MLSDPQISKSGYRLAMRVTGPSSTQEYAFFPEGAWDAMLGRLLGCFLVATMPSAGLRETLVSLKEIYDFNTEREQYALLSKAAISVTTATVASVTEALPLTLQEE